MEREVPVAGPPFTPYFVQCEAMGLEPVDRIEWLRQQPAPPGLLKRATRFNYWRVPEINPLTGGEGVDPWWPGALAESGHQLLSQVYEARHRDGDADAIFTYAKSDASALKASWVVDQLVVWRLENTKASLSAIRRFAAAYTDNTGKGDAKTYPATLAATIRRDQAIVKSLRTARAQEIKLEAALAETADRSHELYGVKLSHAAVRQIHYRYIPVMRELMSRLGSEDRAFAFLTVLADRVAAAGV